MQYINISIPIPVYHPLTWLSGFGLLILLLAKLAAAWPNIQSFIQSTLTTFWPSNDAPAALLRKFALFASPIGILLFLVSIWRLYLLLFFTPDSVVGANSGDDLRAHYLAFVGVGTFLIGLVGIPFAISRIIAIERQTRTQEDSHVTDQINKAVEGLGADKAIKQQRLNDAGKRVYEQSESGEPIYSKPVYEEITAPNIEVRIGAIYALERIAKLNLDEHIQIMEILCAYVRENAKALSLTPTEDLISRPKIRGDIQTALTVIGRRKTHQREKEKNEKFALNLSNSDLSGADLENADLAGALLIKCRIEAAFMPNADLTGAKLLGSLLNHTNFDRTLMRGTRLDNAIINRPKVRSGGMSESITMANIESLSVAGADISSINYLGEFAERKKIFASRNTIIHHELYFDQTVHKNIWNKRRKAIRDNDEKTVRECEIEMEKNGSFPEWLPFDSSDMLFNAELRKFLENNNCVGWPHL